MEDKFLLLDKTRSNFEQVCKNLLEECEGKLFPADILFLASCDRAIQVLDGFSLLMKNGNYSCCMALFRLQLDTVLRMYGITKTKDIHESAHRVICGTKLSDIKDSSGKKLRDAYLVELFAVDNSWVTDVYKICSGYIHLSNKSIYHLVDKAKKISNSTDRIFYIGSDDEYIDIQDKVELLEAFNLITNAVQKFIYEWITNRLKFTTFEDLLKKYPISV